MKFKIGDPVWATTFRPDYGLAGDLAGVVVGYAPFLMPLYLVRLIDHPCPVYAAHVEKGLWTATENVLRPRRDDGLQKIEWAQCLWQPKPASVEIA